MLHLSLPEIHEIRKPLIGRFHENVFRHVFLIKFKQFHGVSQILRPKFHEVMVKSSCETWRKSQVWQQILSHLLPMEKTSRWSQAADSLASAGS